jgi:hypothetical protein
MKDNGYRFNLDGLYPKNVPVYLPGREEQVNVAVHDFETCLFSLLSNPSLMQQEHLLFDPHNPQEYTGCTGNNDDDNEDGEDNTDANQQFGDVNQSRCFRLGRKEYCMKPEDFLCPLIFFIDGTPIDVHGNLSMEPVQMTLGIFNQQARTRPEFWVTIGYVNSDKTKQSAYEVSFDEAVQMHNFSKKKKKKKKKVTVPPTTDLLEPEVSHVMQDYHRQLSVIFAEVQRVQTQGGLRWKWSHSLVTYPSTEFLLKVPILFIIGDTVGHDKLCALKAGGQTVSCRICSCPQHRMDDPEDTSPRTKMSDLMKMSRDDLKKKGYHGLKNNAFYGLSFCDSIYGLNGCTAAEILHHLQQGLDPYVLVEFSDLPVRLVCLLLCSTVHLPNDLPVLSYRHQ